jgi:hypothetical protein
MDMSRMGARLSFWSRRSIPLDDFAVARAVGCREIDEGLQDRFLRRGVNADRTRSKRLKTSDIIVGQYRMLI